MGRKEYEEKVELNKTVDKVYDIPCIRCLNDTRHKVLFSADIVGEVPKFQVDYWEEYQIVQCQGCNSISFRKCTSNSEEMDHIEMSDGSYEAEYVESIEIYPSRIAGRGMVKREWLLPAKVLKVYSETHSALSNKLFILGSIGMRALLESVCLEKKAVGRNLQKKIDDLVAKGVLTQEGAEILHTLRILGNESAHQMVVQDGETIDLAMDVVESLLQSVYILPRATTKLRKAVEKKK